MNYDTLETIIKERRTIKPETHNGKIIPDEDIHALLQLANWAPTHGYTEPWRFVVFSEDGLQAFSSFHADLYKQKMESLGKEPVKYDKILNRAKGSSHLIAIGMKRGSNPKIPRNEEHISAGIAAYNLWLGATTKGIACYWGSGGMTYEPEMAEYLGLDPAADKVLGFLFLGYSDETPRPGRRLSEISEKVEWRLT